MPTYKITNVAANKCLNIYGDNVTSLTNNQNVTLWADSNSAEQKWVIDSLGTRVYVKSAINTAFALNTYRGSTYNCDVYPLSGNETDAAVNFVSSGSSYKIQLSNYPTYYLTAAGTANGSNVYWATATNTSNQLWNCSELDEDDTLGSAVSSFNDLSSLSELDIISRCIYSEAGNQTDEGKRGVACVLRNRKQHSRFPSTYSAIVLQGNGAQFSGMTTAYALRPDTTLTNWKNSVLVAKQIDSVANPIGTCVFFNTKTAYANASQTINGVEQFKMSGTYYDVLEKVTIGNHVFFRITGY